MRARHGNEGDLRGWLRKRLMAGCQVIPSETDMAFWSMAFQLSYRW